MLMNKISMSQSCLHIIFYNEVVLAGLYIGDILGNLNLVGYMRMWSIAECDGHDRWKTTIVVTLQLPRCWLLENVNYLISIVLWCPALIQRNSFTVMWFHYEYEWKLRSMWSGRVYTACTLMGELAYNTSIIDWINKHWFDLVAILLPWRNQSTLILNTVGYCNEV